MRIIKDGNCYHKVTWYGRKIETLRLGNCKFEKGSKSANASIIDYRNKHVSYYDNQLDACITFFDLPIHMFSHFHPDYD